MGDSFAEGFPDRAYLPFMGFRSALFNKLDSIAPSWVDIQFVGTNLYHAGSGNYLIHASRRGATSYSMHGGPVPSWKSQESGTIMNTTTGGNPRGLDGWATLTTKPHVVVVQLGFNDIVNNPDISWETYRANMNTLMGIIKLHFPSAVVFVCTICPKSVYTPNSADFNAKVSELNAKISLIVSENSNVVMMVNIHSNIADLADYVDGSHLLATGDAKVANAIGSAFKNYFSW